MKARFSLCVGNMDTIERDWKENFVVSDVVLWPNAQNRVDREGDKRRRAADEGSEKSSAVATDFEY